MDHQKEDILSQYVRYSGDGEWSALYLDGHLVNYGDHYIVDEEISRRLGVEDRQSDDFMLGTHNKVAKTLQEIEQYHADEEKRAQEAALLRAKAEALLKQAQELERK